MRATINILLTILLLLCSNLSFGQHELKMVNIGDFTTTSGEIIKDCKVGYRTAGILNSKKSNVILWPTWFEGTSESIAKPSTLPKMLDTTGFYIIMVDALGNGVSSSPSNTDDFPEISIRDMVNSQYELLVNHLNINHLYAVVGLSLGGIQTFEWMVAYPKFMDKAIPMIGTPRLSSFDIYHMQSQLDLITDAGSKAEDINIAYKRAYDIAVILCYTPSFIAQRIQPEDINSWRENQYNNLIDYKDYSAGLKAMLKHDIYKSSGCDPENISSIVEAGVLVIVATQDHMVNPLNAISFSEHLGCDLVKLEGDCGHISIWCESAKVKVATTAFLRKIQE